VEDDDNGYMEYPIVQYLIVGDSGDFKKTRIGDIEIRISVHHPDATYEGEHFIIDAGAFHIKCRYDKYNFD
jgi:hypothetical protein